MLLKDWVNASVANHTPHHRVNDVDRGNGSCKKTNIHLNNAAGAGILQRNLERYVLANLPARGGLVTSSIEQKVIAREPTT